ncbi:MAG: murein L,D-transpeptidase [Hyphomicrobiaceae bacterium]|nr:murein L,D-transpeptidase [Hyphomicrobiaceae bacterium]
MRGTRVGVMIAAAGLLAACAQVEIPPYLQPLSKDTMMLLGRKGMRTDQAIFVRIFKEESELEVWKQRDDGRFHHFKTYPICNWSGELGPKTRQGDRQAPEGFYRVSRHQMNPNSQFHLAFNLGYPNAFDKAHRRTGEFLMVHGKCKSAGCYAMTDALIEEIYALSREAFIGGQDGFEVHALPFRMTDENMARHRNSPHYRFWATLKEGYDYFELTRVPPAVAMCEKRYLVNVRFRGPVPPGLDGDSYCPAYEKPAPEPFNAGGEQIAEERVVAPGPKMRSLASIGSDAPSGLTNPEAGGVPAATAGNGWRSVSRALGFTQ